MLTPHLAFVVYHIAFLTLVIGFGFVHQVYALGKRNFILIVVVHSFGFPSLSC